MSRAKTMRVVINEYLDPIEVWVDTHTDASKLLSWYAVEALNGLKAIAKVVRVRR